MSFTEEHLAGRPDLARRVFEFAGVKFNGKRRGHEYKAQCLFHQPDDDPSMDVNLDKAVYTCRACGAGGDAVELLMRKTGATAEAAIARIRDELGIARSRRYPPIKSWPLKDAAGNLVATHHFCGFNENGKKDLPWEPTGVKTDDLPLYGVDRLVRVEGETPTVIVVEGEKTTDALLEHGFRAVGTVTGARGNPSAKAFEPLIGFDVVLSPDNEDVGRKHMDRCAATCRTLGIRPRLLGDWGATEEGDDLADFFGRGRTDAQLDQLLAEAREYPEQSVIELPSDWIRPGDGLFASPLPMARVVTGFETLDKATRGGLPTGSATLALAPPDGGKTGLAMTVADQAVRQGFVVVHLAPDGGREAAEIRWAQLMGFDRQKLEERNPEELALFRAEFAARNVYLPDPDKLEGLVPVNTLDRVIETARRAFEGRKVFLLADSLQTVKPDAESHEGPRARVDAVLALIERAVNVPGWHVFATSHTNRASRRFKREDDNADPMTAGMESGAIEHVFELMIYLDGDAAGVEGVRARITKNKPGAGRKPIFRLAWSREKARFSEMNAAELERETVAMVERNSKAFLKEILALVTKHPGLSTHKLKIKAGRRREAVEAALEDLKKAELVISKERGHGEYWYPAESIDPEASEP